VELVVDLPVELAENVEEVRDRDPEFITKAIRYAFARRVIFDELKSSIELRPGAAGPPGIG